MSLILDSSLLYNSHPRLLLSQINSFESLCLILYLIFGLFQPLLKLLSPQEFLVFLQVNSENHSIDHSHLSKELECILANVSSLIMQASNHALEKSEVMHPGYHIGFGQLNKDFANLGPAVGTLIMETLV